MLNELNWFWRPSWTISRKMPFLFTYKTTTAFGFRGLVRVLFFEELIRFFGSGSRRGLVFLFWRPEFLKMGSLFCWTSAIFFTLALNRKMGFFTSIFEKQKTNKRKKKPKKSISENQLNLKSSLIFKYCLFNQKKKEGRNSNCIKINILLCLSLFKF